MPLDWSARPEFPRLGVSCHSPHPAAGLVDLCEKASVRVCTEHSWPSRRYVNVISSIGSIDIGCELASIPLNNWKRIAIGLPIFPFRHFR